VSDLRLTTATGMPTRGWLLPALLIGLRPRARHTPGHRVIVSGVSRETSWQV
jgi:hypothetical protein